MINKEVGTMVLAYVVSMSQMDNVTVIDTKTHSAIATISSRNIPDNANIAITPDGKIAYVATSNGNTVIVIDIKTHSVIATIQVENNKPPQRFVSFTPDGKLAYVGNNIEGTVSVLT
ncbi:YncE family protein [Cytobacillus sp. Hm23]